jgi:hypothetical protein
MTTPSPPLSPAAQAVLTEITQQEYGLDPADIPLQACHMAYIAAAALRAAADQVVPHIEEPDWGACNYMKCDIELYTDHQRKRAQLLAIAAELEDRKR